MNTPDAPASVNRYDKALPALLVVVSIGLGWVLAPFYGVILWAVIIALLFTPLHCRLLPRLKHRATAAALLTLLAVLIIVILPFVLVTAALTREAAWVYARLQSGELNPVLYLRGVFDALPLWMTSLLDRFGLDTFEVLQRRMSAGFTQASFLQAMRSVSARTHLNLLLVCSSPCIWRFF